MDGGYPQTNLQLLNRLRSAGWPTRDLVLLHNAYEWAMPLFSAQFRSSGKPFLAHLVGTAGILAGHGAGPAVVAAGLLHAGYAQGEWGDGSGRTPTAARRQRLHAAMGAEVEDLVHRYTLLTWSPATVADIRVRAAWLTPPESEIVFIRLANLLEDYLDLGMAYSDKGKKPTHDDPVLADAVVIARALGHAILADELERAVDDNHGADLPPHLRRRALSSGTLAPRSHRLRPSLAARSAASRARKGVGRFL